MVQSSFICMHAMQIQCKCMVLAPLLLLYSYGLHDITLLIDMAVPPFWLSDLSPVRMSDRVDRYIFKCSPPLLYRLQKFEFKSQLAARK